MSSRTRAISLWIISDAFSSMRRNRFIVPVMKRLRAGPEDMSSSVIALNSSGIRAAVTVSRTTCPR